MTHSTSKGSWFPDEKRNNVEFFKKLHMLRDDLHVKERENMKSAIARIQSKKYRNYPIAEKREKDQIRFGEMSYRSRFSEIKDVVGIKNWRDGGWFEVQETMLRPWEIGQNRISVQSAGQRLNQGRLHYKLKSQAIKSKKGHSTPSITNQRQSDTRISSLTDNTITRIATNMNDFDSNKDYDFMRNPDHLPSIPSVGHRVSITHKNRLKAMTWESEFSEPSKMKKKETAAKDSPFDGKTTHETTVGKQSMNKVKHEGLKFAVSLKDKEVFKYLNREVLPSTPSTPPPPINSFPGIPMISFSEGTESTDDDSLDSSRSDGELKSAMRKFVAAHENFEALKEELESIAHMNDLLENSESSQENSHETVGCEKDV